MARLNVQKTAGWNAGKNYYARPFRITDIVIDPEVSKVFKINDKIFDEISQKMRASGYDKSQPVVIWKGENILLDGHTRLAAAKELELAEIPAVEMEFENREDALLYTFERQAVRRNLSSAEILAAAQMIHGRKEKDGKGRAAEQLAGRLGVSPATIYQARKIMMEAPEEDLKAVQAGEKSIKSVYTKIARPRKEAVRNPDKGIPGKPTGLLPENIKFLKSAVVLLIDSQQPDAARLLINHFLKKNERARFIRSFFQEKDKTWVLPENIRKALVLYQ
jgi:ParB family chromosome partitioning protein